MHQRFLLILILFAISHPGFAQHFDEKNFTHYTTISGLSDNYITGITQDKFGYIWISTTNGLNRFDGKEIKRLYQNPGKEGLIADKLSSIKSVENKLFTYSEKGAAWIDLTKNHFINLTVSKKQPASSLQNAVYDAAVTNNNTCFISTYSGAYAFDSTGKLIFRYDNYKPDSNGNIISDKRYGRSVVYIDQYKILHFDMQYNMSIYDSRKNSFLLIESYKNSLPGLYSLKGTMNIRGSIGKNKLLFLNFITWELFIYDTEKDSVRKSSLPVWFRKYIGWASHWLMIDDSTAITYGNYKGAYKVHINPATLQFSYDSVPLLNKYVFTAAFLDRENRLWLGTENGLFRQNIKQSALHPIRHPSSGDPNLYYIIPFYCFLRSNDLLYAGSYSYSPIIVLDGKTYQLKKQISFSRVSPMCNQIWHVIEYSKDTLWFGTQDGLIWYNQRNENFGRVSITGMDTLTQRHAITILYKDSKGIIWMQEGWGSGVIMYNPVTKTSKIFSITDKKNYLPLRVANFIMEDNEQNIWFGERGLTRWNRKKEILDTLITAYYGFNKDNIKISALSNDEKGNLVFCNENNGVLIYDPVANTYKQISTEQGLQENAAYTAISANNYLWIVTHNYLTAFNKTTSKVVSYSYADSLPQGSCNVIYHDTVSHRILMGYDNEITWTDDTIATSANKPISFYIDALHIAEDTTYLFPGENIDLTHSQNNITIHYSAINFDEAESNRYAYRINQNRWVSLGSENSIYFSNLAPGKYEVEIKYYAASNINSETIKKITFIIYPPFWKRWWFFTLIGLAIISIIYLYYSRRISEVRHKARVDRQMAEYEIKALHAQMNPHFIFNCLNSIREMILNNENRQASHYLSKFAQLIRITLNNSSKPFISLQNTIDYLRRYLEMEQIRTSNFSYHITVDDAVETENTFLPPMLIQPFIENAIWHGVSSTYQPIKINICFTRKNNQLLCIIEDNGIGIGASLKNKKQQGETQADYDSLGITNVHQRIQVLNEKYHLHSSVTIEDKNNLPLYNETGTLVTIYLPLKNTEL